MSDVGIIGQIYEDRRTHKKGKLLERDEKYKTLLMESYDGKSFNITYGGFKSNWRKVDEEVPTIEEAMQEVEVPVEPVKEESQEVKPVVKKKQKRKEREVSKGFETATLKLLEYVNSFNSPKTNANVIPSKRNLVFRVSGHRITILTYLARKDSFRACVYEDVFLLFKDKDYISTGMFNENWQSMKYSFVFSSSDLDRFFEDLRPYVTDFICE